jgi:hypothetical protein
MDWRRAPRFSAAALGDGRSAFRAVELIRHGGRQAPRLKMTLKLSAGIGTVSTSARSWRPQTQATGVGGGSTHLARNAVRSIAGLILLQSNPLPPLQSFAYCHRITSQGTVTSGVTADGSHASGAPHPVVFQHAIHAPLQVHPLAIALDIAFQVSSSSRVAYTQGRMVTWPPE